jgi:hypothetical protein
VYLEGSVKWFLNLWLRCWVVKCAKNQRAHKWSSIKHEQLVPCNKSHLLNVPLGEGSSSAVSWPGGTDGEKWAEGHLSALVPVKPSGVPPHLHPAWVWHRVSHGPHRSHLLWQSQSQATGAFFFF